MSLKYEPSSETAAHFCKVVAEHLLALAVPLGNGMSDELGCQSREPSTLNPKPLNPEPKP